MKTTRGEKEGIPMKRNRNIILSLLVVSALIIVCGPGVSTDAAKGIPATGLSDSRARKIAEHALRAALRAETLEVERCYKMLCAPGFCSSVVVEIGSQAVPMLQSYLAYQYIQNGRLKEARTMIRELRVGYSHCDIPRPVIGGGIEWRSVPEVVRELRHQMYGATTGRRDGMIAPPWEESLPTDANAWVRAKQTAELALDAALRMETLEVERCYAKLRADRSSESIVTDMGVEAIPAIQGYLAYQYVQNGRFKEAEAMMRELGATHAHSEILVPGPGGLPESRPVRKIVKELRRQMQAAVDRSS
jgi:hypothetical protein